MKIRAGGYEVKREVEGIIREGGDRNFAGRNNSGR